MSGPEDKWYKVLVSTTSDAHAQTSTAILGGLNTDYSGVPGMTTVVCSDGTFMFIGVYAEA
jgi:hypothetical protein